MTRPRDDVDRIVAAWGRERPDLTLTPMEVLSRVTRLARRLDGARKDAFASHGLEAWSFDVLAALRRAGEPYCLSPGQLSQETLVTSGTMTNRIDRLEALGLVERRRDTADRRGVLVSLTPAGRSRVDAAFEALVSREHELLEGIDGDRLAELADQLRQVMVQLEASDA